MYTLGIESSCDETSCAVLKDYRVVSNITLSSLKEHRKYGGVVPEIAARAHLKNIDKVLTAALKEAAVPLEKLGLISATYKPGLSGALVVGLNFAKALSLALKKPFIGVNHLHAHLFSPFLNYRRKLKFPFLGVVVSGGHSEIYRVNDFDKIKILGRTRDDACGEVFDKVAKAYGLGYPGGPLIDRIFSPKDKDAFSFKCGRIGYDLSFSGIKTALIYKRDEIKRGGAFNYGIKRKLLSSFQHAAMEAIIGVISEAWEKQKLKRVVCGGGVIANKYLRQRLKEEEKGKMEVLLSPREYAGDNAAIVAGLGFYLYNIKGKQSGMDLKARAN